MAWKFEAHHLYKAVKEWHDDINPKMRVDRIMVHDVFVGNTFRFRGANLGRAEFLDPIGRLLCLSGKVAFQILQPANKRVQPTDTSAAGGGDSDQSSVVANVGG